MYKVLTLNKISKIGLSQLPEEMYSISDDEKNPDAILLRSFKMHDMELPESLLTVARCGAGYNNIPTEKCAEKGIVVFNTPGANANAVKELVITALLISSRKIVESYNWAQSLKDSTGVPAAVEKGKAQFIGPELSGKTLGIIGLGAVGSMVADSAIALGMKVIGYDPFLSVSSALRLDSSVIYTQNIDELYEVSDYITVHVPCNPATERMFRKESFNKMKDGVRIINLARGELVDDNDIKEAISSGKVSRYVTDFPNENTVGIEGIITLPHLGASTPEAEDNCASMAASEMRAYIEEGNIINSVNYPSCVMARYQKNRICVLYKNFDDAISSISSTLAVNNINISNMMSNSYDGFAYTIIDTDSNVDNSIVDSLKNINGIIRVRIIN